MNSRSRTVALLAVAITGVVVGLLLVASGKTESIRYYWGVISTRIARAPDVGRAVIDARSVQGPDDGRFANIIFLHQSVGRNLIDQGGVREGLAAAGYNFWDHGYNEQELRRPNGTSAGYSYGIPGDNTDPYGLLTIFSQQVYDVPLNTLSGLMQHEVIAFKSCFPASDIVSDAQLDERKMWYLKIRDFFDEHPEKLFMVITQPPLNPAESNAEAAARARAFANWLKSDEFLRGHPNVFTFDLFDALAESNPALPDFNMLRESYRTGTDSHPNLIANETVGPRFVDFLVKGVASYRDSYQPTASSAPSH